MWRAEQLGGPEHIGWTPDTYRAADILDAIMANVAVTGHIGAKGQPKMPEPSYRPKAENAKQSVPQDLDDPFITSLVTMIGKQ